MPISPAAAKKIDFLRRYGPISENGNMYDELINKEAEKSGSTLLTFHHPWEQEILECFSGTMARSVILTGAAGDGKTHLCKQIWHSLGGSLAEWENPGEYFQLPLPPIREQPRWLHIIRDLTAWGVDSGEWPPEKAGLLQQFSQSVIDGKDTDDLFLLAVNDGQLGEVWRTLPESDEIMLVQDSFERMLYRNQKMDEGLRLSFFNLSSVPSVHLFEIVLKAFLQFDGWEACLRSEVTNLEAFGSQCPIRRNYELLNDPLVQQRLAQLFALCDANDLHIPIRQILLLLANSVFGHRSINDYLLQTKNISQVIANHTISEASFYNNVFGGNLPAQRRKKYQIFQYFERFRIGQETSSFTDNVILLGQTDDNWKPDFDLLIRSDPMYLATSSFMESQQNYFEGAQEDSESRHVFVDHLLQIRRGVFFRIPEDRKQGCQLWQLTVFTYAGEYLDEVVTPLSTGKKVKQSIRHRLVRGLNRIFTGMLVATERELILATSLSSTTARISRILEAMISVDPKRGEYIDIEIDRGSIPQLVVHLSKQHVCRLTLYLTRYEFLSRVALGALPSSFSKECYEDILAFKSQVLMMLTQRQTEENDPPSGSIRLLSLNDAGHPDNSHMIYLPEEIEND